MNCLSLKITLKITKAIEQVNSHEVDYSIRLSNAGFKDQLAIILDSHVFSGDVIVHYNVAN